LYCILLLYRNLQMEYIVQQESQKIIAII